MPSRVVQAELLDALPHDHIAARRSRRDLRIINLLMGNHAWLARVLQAHVRPAEHLLELGAGTGEFARRRRRQGWRIDGLDVCPAPAGWPAAERWHRADLRHFAGYGAYDAVCGNLIFHQFTDAELGALGARLPARIRLIAACEPARRRRSQWLYRSLSPLFGASQVTHHDARVSIAAGFLGDELPRLLGLDAGSWDWYCTTTLRGAYRMIARRRAAPA
ncbi:MAG: hypothetical protein WC485_02230 [Opitutaceae bacterium]